VNPSMTVSARYHPMRTAPDGLRWLEISLRAEAIQTMSDWKTASPVVLRSEDMEWDD